MVEIGHKVSTATLKGTSSTVLVGENEEVISDIVVLDKTGERMVETHLLLGDSQASQTLLDDQVDTTASSRQLKSDLDLHLEVPEDIGLESSENTTDIKVDWKSPLKVSGNLHSKSSGELSQHKIHDERPASKLRGSTGTSPDVDDLASSEGFTTADFFIDESMPSSMTESAPSKKVAELQLIVQEKTAVIEVKDKELQCKTVELDAFQTVLQARDVELKECKTIIVSKDEEVQELNKLYAKCRLGAESNETELQECQKQLECQQTELHTAHNDLQSSQRHIQELQSVVELKSSEIEAVKEAEMQKSSLVLQDLKTKLMTAEDQFKLLHDVAEKGALQLKCEVLSLEKQTVREKDELQVYMDTVTKKVIEMINKFEEHQTGEHQKILVTLKEEQAAKLVDVEQQLQVERDKVTVAEEKVETYKFNVTESSDQCQAIKDELKDFTDKHESALTALRNQLMLENEVELERAKANLVQQIEEREKENKELSEKLERKKNDILGHIREKEQITEKLSEQYQHEKEEIVRILEKEYQEKLQSHELRFTEQTSKSHEEELQKLKTMSEKVKAEECEKRQGLKLEHHEAFEKLQVELAEKHTVDLGNLRATLLQEMQGEMSAELEKMKREGVQPQTEDGISLEKHAQMVTEMTAAHEDARDQAVAQVLIISSKLYRLFLQFAALSLL